MPQPGFSQRTVSPPRSAAGADAAHERANKTLQALGSVSIQPGPLLAVLAAPVDDPDKVAAAIELSPALAARVLSVTNSAAVGLSRPIDTIRRAVLHLGASRARVVALAYGLRILSEGAGLDPQLQRQLWVCSLRKAYAARLAAEAIDPANADQAYAAALLQDVGLPMLMAVDPMFYSHELRPGAAPWHEQERERFGLDHAVVGSRLLMDWNVASKLCDAVLDHHRPPTRDLPPDAVRRLPGFVASLLPHRDEPPTAGEHEWLIAVTAQFLAARHPSPEAFAQAANQAAAAVYRPIADMPWRIDAGQAARMIGAVSLDSEAMVAQLSHLEHAVGQQRERLSHLRFQAFTDPLTKVLNRRGFEHLAQRRLAIAADRQLGVCTLVLDLDDFKQVNDRYGHEAGDVVLRAVAKLLRRGLERGDLVGRLGGDEFAALLIGLGEADAQKVIDRFSKSCQGTRVKSPSGEELPVRVSVGAAYCHPPATATIQEFIAAADEAMYERKRNGKSGFAFASVGPPRAA